jgi:Flp pilus assembly pilin Flp
MGRLLLNWRHTIGERLRGRYADRGAGFVEYAGLLILIAGVVVAVFALDIATEVSNAVRDAVLDITGDDG